MKATSIALTVILVGIMAAAVPAQTPVPGATITGHEIWDAGGSPYLVTGVVDVLAGASLTIEPGVLVDFGTTHIEFGVIRVWGDLTATDATFDGTQVAEADNWFIVEMRTGGTATLSGCTLKGRWAPPNAHGKDWRGIHWFAEGVGPVIIEDCAFSGFNNALSMTRDGYADVKDCRFAGVNSGVSIGDSCHLEITGCGFTDFEAFGITVGELFPPPGTEKAIVNVGNCSFSDANGKGIRLIRGSIDIQNCCFENLDTAVTNWFLFSGKEMTAADCWWGSPNGPTHTSNPGGDGEFVSDHLDFMPYASVDPGCDPVCPSGISLITEFHDLDDNLVPPGWTEEIQFGGPGISDGALRGHPTDGRAWLRRDGCLPACADGIRFEYDGNIAYSFWGMSNAVGVELASGATYQVSCGMADFNYGMVTRVRMDATALGTFHFSSYPFETTVYHFTVTFYDGLMEFKAEKISDGSILFDLSEPAAGLSLAEVEMVWFQVKGRSDNNAWIDNLSVEVLGACAPDAEICDAFLTPEAVRIGSATSAGAIPRERHSFKIHLMPCEPMDVRVGDSAEVYVDVDGSGTFDDDELYAAVVSSTDVDGAATDIAIKVFCGDDLVDNDPQVAILSVAELTVADDERNAIDYLQLNTFTPGLAAGQAVVPSDFGLAQNYPNPFNAGTVIPYTLETGGPMELSIYDVRGRRVLTLVNGVQSPGRHEVPWDGTDDRGRAVASGMYFYRLTAGELAVTRPMVLLK